jgi:hypothetical protein
LSSPLSSQTSMVSRLVLAAEWQRVNNSIM